MNGQQQRERHTAVSQLDTKIGRVADTFDTVIAELRNELRAMVGQECTHRLDLAKEQRSYVDGADRRLRVSMVDADERLSSRILAFESLTLWGRIRWCVTGRIESATPPAAVRGTTD